ncbi:Protein of unknown function DUF3189 [Syntrophomonas zehnderi OL-4]|uniref:DUF3189 family protein n=1 Tax=Syntrophomonas zehnderi OL-4 TaxID=690567 RepID=A0A0E4G9R6_9FIRM|nr:DUF3189 family protein [Syntrophomonas zehnderi]CFX21207.1 Protein of unknown function DUF3189 [Syntrophomonas zehnderi OL-4]
MKIIYHCYGGSHSSVTAAALHLGWLDKDKLPNYEELMALPYYDKTNDSDFGSIRFMGRDDMENEIYVLGKKSLGNRFNHILMGVAKIINQEDQLVVVNVMKHVNWSMKIGGFTSRRINIPLLGRPVVIWGTRKAFEHMTRLVEATRLRVINSKQV